MPLSVHEVSLVENPFPTTVTVAPTAGEVGVKDMDAAPLSVPTVNVVDAESSSGMPFAVIVYELTPTSPTVNEPVNVPSEIEHVADVTGVPDSEQE